MLFGASVLPSSFQLISAALGGTGILKIIEEIIRVLERKDEIVRDTDTLFIENLERSLLKDG
jgi:hypothetical protein